jgi:thiamine-monophosphate kinase
MKEFDLIKQLTAGLPVNSTVVAGCGDDCAVLDLGIPERVLLFKTDAVVEGVHFERKCPGRDVGHKALARCLSDIAAMGGTPTAAVITLGLPNDDRVQWVQDVYAGLTKLAKRQHVAIVGGETTQNPGGVLISVALVGWALRGKAVLRSGARPGDALFVSGELGGSISGKHLTFEPRLPQGRWLAEHFPVRGMIDLSDGLAGDLRHILNASGVGAELLASSIPISREAKLVARKSGDLGKPALVRALTDGEDFELLFCVPSRYAVSLLDGWHAEFPGLRLTCIGKITAATELILRDKQGARPLNLHGYTHFS